MAFSFLTEHGSYETSTSRGGRPCILEPTAHLVVDISSGIQLQVMGKAPRRRLDDLFPSWRHIATTERECEHQWGGFPAEILARHPYPRKRLAPSERDLAFAYAKLCGSDGFNRKAHGLKDLPGVLLSREKLFQCDRLFLIDCGSYPNVVFRRHVTACLACVYRAGQLNQHGFTFVLGEWLVLYSPGDDKHLSRLEIDPAVPKVNAHLPLDDDKRLVRIIVTVPDEITLELDQLEMVIVHLGDDLWRPMF
jgi:hypothetical protein